MKKLNYQHNSLLLRVEGNFKDGDTSIYYFGENQSWHITFEQGDNCIKEVIKDISLESDSLGKKIVLSDWLFICKSDFKTMVDVKKFISELPDYKQYRDIIFCYMEYFEYLQIHRDDLPF